ncbi:MAG: hypothetical protein HY909_23590 [Deltaproteobacteria bacterium]|nr:hypothetical protein [Deltaproteobacteria bacterium]
MNAVWCTVSALGCVAFLLGCGGSTPPPPGDGAAGEAGDVGDAADASPAGDATDAPVCTGGAEAPLPRGDAVGVVDPVSGALYVFGGDVGPTVNCIPAPAFQDDSWRYDPGCDRWRRLPGDLHPSARSRSAWALDARRRRLVLFGGRYRRGGTGNYSLYRDVWALDLATEHWEELQTTGAAPSARANAVAVYDSEADEFVVHGGNTSVNGAAFTPRGDAFALNLETLAWRSVAASGPPARLFHAAAARGRTMVLVGGGDERAFQGPFLRDAWSLDLSAGTWSRLALSGETAFLGGRISAALVPDPGGDGYVLLGGHDDGALGNRNDVLGLSATGAVRILRNGDALRRAGMGFCNFPADFTDADLEAPERRSAFVVGVDTARRRALVYGGKTDCGLAGDVWAVNLVDGAWTLLRGTQEGLSCVRSGRMACTSLCQ